MVYEWKGRAYRVSANDVGREVERIEREQGEVTARRFLDAARSEDSILHSLFEWDDEKAAEQYRLRQATTILCALSITTESTQEPTQVRAYMNVASEADNPTRRTGTFINTQKAFEDKEKRNLILRVALRELRELRLKYSMLKELKAVFDAIDSLEDISEE